MVDSLPRNVHLNGLEGKEISSDPNIAVLRYYQDCLPSVEHFRIKWGTAEVNAGRLIGRC